MIWFTSDLHLGHNNIIRHCNRPFRDAQQMDAALIASINARVARSDELYILGDFTMYGSREQVRTYRSRLFCDQVHLVLGNHDKRFAQAGDETPFSTERDYAEIKNDGLRLCCSHYPMLSWHGMNRGAIMLHGHIHAYAAYNLRNRERGILRYDVGVDAHGYEPVSAAAIAEFFRGVEPSLLHHEGEWEAGGA